MPTGPNYTEDEMLVIEKEIEAAINNRSRWSTGDRPRIFRSGSEVIGVITGHENIRVWHASPAVRREAIKEFEAEDYDFPFQPSFYVRILDMDRKLVQALMPDFLEMLGPLASLAAADL